MGYRALKETLAEKNGKTENFPLRGRRFDHRQQKTIRRNVHGRI